MIVAVVLTVTGLMNNNLPFYPDLEIQDMTCSKCSMSVSGLSLKYEVKARVWVTIKNNKLKRQITLKDFKGNVYWSSKKLGNVGKVSVCSGDERYRLPLTVKAKKESVMCVDFQGSMSVGLTDAVGALKAYCGNSMQVQATGFARVGFGVFKKLPAPFSYKLNVQPKRCDCTIASTLC